MPKYLIAYRKTEDTGPEARVGRRSPPRASLAWRRTPSRSAWTKRMSVLGEKLWGNGEVVWIGAGRLDDVLYRRDEAAPETSIVYGLSRSRSCRAEAHRPQKILLIGSGPIVIGQACEFDYSGTQAVQGPARGRLRGRARQLEPGHHHDRPRDGRPHVHRAAHAGVRGEDHRARAARRAAADGGRPDRPQPRGGAGRGRHARPLRRRADRRQARPRSRRRRTATSSSAAMERIGLAHARSGFYAQLARGGARGHRGSGGWSYPAHHPARPSPSAAPAARSPTTPRSSRPRVKWGLQQSPGPAGARRGVGDRLEGVRARGDARPRRQRRHHLLDRELRPDGRAHRRLDHGGARPDAHRQGIPAHARRRRRDHPRDRRRDGRLEHPVRASTPTTAAWS